MPLLARLLSINPTTVPAHNTQSPPLSHTRFFSRCSALAATWPVSALDLPPHASTLPAIPSRLGQRQHACQHPPQNYHTSPPRPSPRPGHGWRHARLLTPLFLSRVLLLLLDPSRALVPARLSPSPPPPPPSPPPLPRLPISHPNPAPPPLRIPLTQSDDDAHFYR